MELPDRADDSSLSLATNRSEPFTNPQASKCVATLVWRAVSIISLASFIRFASGLCTATCLPCFIAAMAMAACEKSGVTILTASMPFSFSSNSRKSA